MCVTRIWHVARSRDEAYLNGLKMDFFALASAGVCMARPRFNSKCPVFWFFFCDRNKKIKIKNLKKITKFFLFFFRGSRVTI